MDNFYKYLPLSQEDIDWGLQILHAGTHKHNPGIRYPEVSHPAHHNFNWENGRILQEFALLYITGGSGVYNSALTGDITVQSGSAILIFPYEKHRYKPNPNTGWKEYWVGFDGTFMNSLVDRGYFDPRNPIYYIGYNETVINMFLQVMDSINKEKPGYQPLASGAVMYMLGLLRSSEKAKSIFKGEDELAVDHARMIIRANLTNPLSPCDIAETLNLSYSRFRKLFKEYTGMAPVQYQIQLKLERAKEDLINTTKSVKEIAHELNFDSSQYFSNLFKEKTSMTPVEFKKKFIEKMNN